MSIKNYCLLGRIKLNLKKNIFHKKSWYSIIMNWIVQVPGNIIIIGDLSEKYLKHLRNISSMQSWHGFNLDFLEWLKINVKCFQMQCKVCYIPNMLCTLTDGLPACFHYIRVELQREKLNLLISICNEIGWKLFNLKYWSFLKFIFSLKCNLSSSRIL